MGVCGAETGVWRRRRGEEGEVAEARQHFLGLTVKEEEEVGGSGVWWFDILVGQTQMHLWVDCF